MKNRKISLLFLLSSLLVLGACNPSPSPTSEPPGPTSETPVVEKIDIADLKTTEVGTKVRLEGIVVRHNYTGQETPYKTGVWLSDETGTTYAYGEDLAKAVEVGNKLNVIGIKDYYIPSNDIGAATSMNYKGMLQIKNCELVSNDGGNHPIPTGVIDTNSTLEDIAAIPLTEDITGKIYKVNGRIRKYDMGSYVNYGLDDLNRSDSLLVYTQCNGKDFFWLNDFLDVAREVTFIITLGKPAVNAWRICPINAGNTVQVTDAMEATYSAKRALKEIGDRFEVQTTVNVAIVDEDSELNNLTRSFAATDSDIFSISQNTTHNVIVIKIARTGTFRLTCNAIYNEASGQAYKDIEIVAPAPIEAMTIADAKACADNTEVTVRAIVAKVTFKGSLTKQGLFLVDESDSIFVFNGTDTMGNLTPVNDGNKVVVKGILKHYIKDAANAEAEGYTGDLQITDVTVESLDTNVYDIPTGSYTVNTIEAIMATLPTTNISSEAYVVDCKVKKTANQYFTAYSLVGLVNTSISLSIYSQNNGADFTWLDDYADQNVKIIIGIQNLNLRASGSSWRSVALKVLNVLA